MGLTDLLVLIALGLVASWALTFSMRRYALRTDLVDRPNARSSHTVPTPRGGGVAIAVSFLALSTLMAVTHAIDADLFAALVGGGALVAVVGFVDDRAPMRARWRFAAHLLAAAWVLHRLGPLPAVPLFGVVVDLGVGATLLVALFLLWSINLFNFMDGIDAIASLESVAVLLGGALVWWMVEPAGSWPAALVLAGCVTGFLLWNYPPARIFMGDSGSSFLGFAVAVLCLWGSRTHAHLFWSWMILVGCFWVDATTTLLRRVARGERFYVAHRSHAYQYAARKYGSHQLVSLGYAAVTLVFLLPLAMLVAARRIDGLTGVAIAYAPLVAMAYVFKAGDRRAQEER